MPTSSASSASISPRVSSPRLRDGHHGRGGATPPAGGYAVGLCAGRPRSSTARWLDDRTFVDEWGITFRRSAEGVPYYDPVGHPLAEATLADLDRYVGPDVEDPSRYAGLGEIARDLHGNSGYAVCASTADTTIFDKAWMLRGMAQFLTDLLLDPPFALALLEKVTDIQSRRQAAFLREVGPFIDVTLVADDMGTQRGPIITAGALSGDDQAVPPPLH